MASIIARSENGTPEFYPLGRRTTVIGRSESVPVQILDDRVSRRHLQVRYDEVSNEYVALDMHSTHGTLINERRVSEETVLADGDEIIIGSTRILFTTQDFPDQDSALNHYKQVGQRGKTTLPEM